MSAPDSGHHRSSSTTWPDPASPTRPGAILDLMSEAGAAASLEPDALMGAAAAETGLDDFGPDDFVPRLDVLCRSLARRGQAQRRRRAGPVRAADRPAAQPAPARGPGRSTSRDPGRAGRDAHRHLRAAPHRHHASAQPDVLGPRAPVPALLGEHGAGPGRAGTPGGGRPGPAVGANGDGPVLPRRGHARVQAHARDDGRPRPRGDPAPGHRLLHHAVRDDRPHARPGATTTWPATSAPATPT